MSPSAGLLREDRDVGARRLAEHLCSGGKRLCRELGWERGARAGGCPLLGAGHCSAGPGALVTSRDWKASPRKESYWETESSLQDRRGSQWLPPRLAGVREHAMPRKCLVSVPTET